MQGRGSATQNAISLKIAVRRLATIISPVRPTGRSISKQLLIGFRGDILKIIFQNHQHDPNANELWLYFKAVIDWVNVVFAKYRKEMKGLPWGRFYNEHHTRSFDSQKLEAEIAELMADEDVTNKKGIYEYVLTRKEKHLNIRAFADSQKREAYERQKGICTKCGEYFELADMEADHITPWHEGGKTSAENCQMLCKECNRRKSGK